MKKKIRSKLSLGMKAGRLYGMILGKKLRRKQEGMSTKLKRRKSSSVRKRKGYLSPFGDGEKCIYNVQQFRNFRWQDFDVYFNLNTVLRPKHMDLVFNT